MKREDILDKLQQGSVHIIDILPQQVPQGFGGQYFAVEEYFLQERQRKALFSRFASLVLKLNCYYDIEICSDGLWQKNPPPEEIVEMIVGCGESIDSDVALLIDERSALVINGDFLFISCYQLTAALQLLLAQLAAAEGLFFRQVKE